MGKLLLSSSQVSILLSTTIVFTFTVVLFLSGYVMQQRTVYSLQEAIRPNRPKPLPIPKPIEPPTLDVKWARPVGGRPAVDEAVEQMIAAEALDWSRLGYVQMAREHSEVCSAVMLLADLHKMKSPAKKLLLFPRVWLKEAKDDAYDAGMATTRRLLRTAARRYGVSLIPMEPIVEGADGALPSSYSLATLYSLTEYERLLYLQSPGALLSASALDSLLAFSQFETMAAYPASAARDALSTSMLLIHPSGQVFRDLKEMRAREPSTDLRLFRKAFSVPESLLSTQALSMGNLVYSSQELRQDAAEAFNATAWEDATTFVRLADPELPGPEYDLPYFRKMELQPRDDGARVVWESLYERFRQRRIEVCGLDLEYWQPSALRAGGDDVV